MTNHQILQLLIMIVVIVASVIDMRTKKIPNVLTFGAAFVGIVLNFVLFDWHQGLLAIAGWFTGAIVMVAFKTVGKMSQMGMGDAKLIACIGAFLCMQVLLAWGFFAMFYGAFATFKFITAIPWAQFGKIAKAASVGVPSTLDQESAENLNKVMNKPIALAPIIAVGTLASIILEKPALAFLGFPV